MSDPVEPLIVDLLEWIARAPRPYAEVIVVDDKKPTAVLDAPARVSFGTSFKLSGARSADLPPGRIREFRWLMIS